MSGRGGIVLVTTSFPICGDGREAAGSFVSDLAAEMAAWVPVRVVAPGPVQGHERLVNGVEIFRFRAPEAPLSSLRPWNLLDLLSICRVLNAGAEATRRAVESGETAHIFALWALPCGHWARIVSGESQVPYSVWTLGSDIWSLGRLPIVRSWLRRVLKEARMCYSDGLRLADDTAAIAGRDVAFMPSTRSINAVRYEAPRESTPYRLLFLGRWHPNKGVDLLLDALEQLNDEDWTRIEAVRICGGGSLEPSVRSSVERLRESGRPVELMGYLDKDEAQRSVLWADYLLIPSRIESIPVVFSDAMKLGCPVVAMPVGDLPALVARGVGICADEVSAASYAEAIRVALLEAPSKFEPSIRAVKEEFSIGDIAVRLVAKLSDRNE